jgi:hypothetical protein
MRPIWLSAHDSDCVIRRTFVFAYTSTETKVNIQYSFAVNNPRQRHGNCKTQAKDTG